MSRRPRVASVLRRLDRSDVTYASSIGRARARLLSRWRCVALGLWGRDLDVGNRREDVRVRRSVGNLVPLAGRVTVEYTSACAARSRSRAARWRDGLDAVAERRGAELARGRAERAHPRLVRRPQRVQVDARPRDQLDRARADLDRELRRRKKKKKKKNIRRRQKKKEEEDEEEETSEEQPQHNPSDTTEKHKRPAATTTRIIKRPSRIKESQPARPPRLPSSPSSSDAAPRSALRDEFYCQRAA